MRARRWLLLWVLLLWGPLAPASALAQAPAGPDASVGAEQTATPVDLVELAKQRRESLMFMGLGQRVSRYLKAAGEEMTAGNLEEAKRLLLRLNLDRLNAFERANVFRLLAYVEYQLGEEASALENFEKALAEESLLLKDDVAIMFNVVQLHASLEQWQAMLDSLDRWRRFVPAPTPLSHYLRAVAYYQMERFEESLAAAEAAVDASPEPQESWLQLLAALYVQKEDYASVTPVLEELVVRFPKKSYWVQLSLIYGAREDYRNSLAVQQVAYAQGLLDEDRELQRLARSYVFNGLPYEAAQVLEKGLADGSIERDAEAYELLANSLIQAREFDRSLEPLRIAARLSDHGDLYVRLGQVHMAREQWAEATELFKRAIEKGGLSNPGSAELLLGISYYNDNRVGPARFSFVRAREFEKTRKAADDWLKHIERETEAS